MSARRTLLAAAASAFVLAAGVAPGALAAEGEPEERNADAAGAPAPEREPSGERASEPQVSAGRPAAPPVYVPPEPPTYVPPEAGRGAPSARVGAGVRGIEPGLPDLFALAPEHVGHTAAVSPTLYWFLAAPTRHRVELTLNDAEIVEPLLEIVLPSPVEAGVHGFDLAAHGVRLEPGRVYRWFVAIVPRPARRSVDAVAGGSVLRVPPDDPAALRLAAAAPADRAHVAAEAGLFYDALGDLSQRIAAGGGAPLRAHRDALLDQVGLGTVAREDAALRATEPSPRR